MRRVLCILSLLCSFSLMAKERLVVTSFYPVYITTLNILEGAKDLRLVNMTKPFAGCLHDYQLSPQDLVTLSQAQAFVVNGAGMESFLQKVIQRQKNLRLIEASKDIPLLEGNPHVWLSPRLAVLQVENVAKGLGEIFPEYRRLFEKNAKTYIEKILKLEVRMQSELQNLKSRSLITFHEAFPYFAQAFKLQIVATVEREPGTEPTPKELVSLIKTLKAQTTKVIFTEPQYSPKAAQTLARESGAKIYALDPLVTGAFTRDAYLEGMEKNLQVLKSALSF